LVRGYVILFFQKYLVVWMLGQNMDWRV
jgi:hypothetical protein